METVAKKRRPFSFYVCSFAFSLERFSFYSAKWVIAAFLVATVAKGGLGLTPEEGAKMTSSLIALTYIAPIIGSIISDRYIGAKYLVPVGMLFMAGGYYVGYTAHSASTVYTMIILLAIGTGLFKSQTNAITGRLFDDKKELDSAFSTQYSFVNFGSFIGTTIIGLIAIKYGYNVCFLICSIVMLVNTAWFIFGWRFLGEAGAKPFKVNELAKKEEVKEEKKPLTTLEKKRIAAIVLVSMLSIVFWIFWYLAYMPVYYHWGGENAAANWMIGSFEIPTSWFDSLNALCCIVMGPLLGSFWSKKARSAKGDWNFFQKTAFGMILLGISYVVFALADVLRGGNQASILWLVAFGIILSLGEMVFSPLGNSFITKYAPPRLLSTMMAVWVFAVFFAGKFYGDLYALLRKYPFANAYFTVAGIALGVGILILLLSKKLNNLINEKKEA